MSRYWGFESRIGFVLTLSLFQVYLIPLGDAYLPLALFAGLVLMPEVLQRPARHLSSPTNWIVGALIIVQGVSLFWSPNVSLGIKLIVYECLFLLVFCACRQCRLELLHQAGTVRLFLVCGILLAGLVVVFRAAPTIEQSFLASSWSGVFINPNVQQGIADGTIRVNVFDPAKSGGLFVNGNVASSYLGMLALFSLAVMPRGWLRWTVATFLLVGVFCTGSKTAVLIAVSLSVIFVGLAAGLRILAWRRMAFGFAAIVVTLVVIFHSPLVNMLAAAVDGMASEQGLEQHTQSLSSSASAEATPEERGRQPEPLADAETALDSRFEIWRYGGRSFLEAPLTGQGFGGWQRDFPAYAQAANALGADLQPGFPPHNTFIYLWSQSGLISALLGILLLIHWAWLSVNAVGVASERNGQAALLACSGIWIWLSVHGLADNTGLLGEAHQVVLLAVAVAFIDGAMKKEDRHGA